MKDFNKKTYHIFNFLLLALSLFLFITTINLNEKITDLDIKYQKTASSTEEKILNFQKQIVDTENKLISVIKENKLLASSVQKISDKQSVMQKSEQDLVTSAVAKVTPSVISIVAVKDIPQYEVIYQNPFGDNPIFKDFNIRTPVLRQKGTAPSRVGAGTGFFVTSDGFIVTNKHVVADQSASYTAFTPEGTKNVTVVYRDPNEDVAVLKVSGENYKTVDLGKSADIKLGQTVIAVGNALGEYNNTVSVGIISGLNRTISAKDSKGVEETLENVIQIDAAINPGNSGGTLINLEGKAIGINVATVTGSSNISFSIPIDRVKTSLKNALGKNF